LNLKEDVTLMVAHMPYALSSVP